MPDTVTPDMFVAIENGSTQNRPSEHIKLATDWIAVERNHHQLIDSFIRMMLRETVVGDAAGDQGRLVFNALKLQHH